MAETSFLWTIEADRSDGANVDIPQQVIRWYDGATPCTCGELVACGCVESTVVQSFELFKQDGPALTSVPADVLTEMEKAAAEG